MFKTPLHEPMIQNYYYFLDATDPPQDADFFSNTGPLFLKFSVSGTS